MPIFMDRHEMAEVTAEAVAEAHMEDLKLQRFSSEGLKHHRGATLGGNVGERGQANSQLEELRTRFLSQRKIKVITPYA